MPLTYIFTSKDGPMVNLMLLCFTTIKKKTREREKKVQSLWKAV